MHGLSGKGRVILVPVLVVLVGLLTCLDCQARRRRGRRKKAGSASVGFSITLDREKYGGKDPIIATFHLVNNSSRAVFVNKRFFVKHESSPENERDVYFIVKGPSGEKLPEKERDYSTGLPKSDDFVELKPGEETSSDKKTYLKGYFDIEEPGTFTVQAVYDNIYGPEVGLDTVRCTLESEPVRIEVVEKDTVKEEVAE